MNDYLEDIEKEFNELWAIRAYVDAGVTDKQLSFNWFVKGRANHIRTANFSDAPTKIEPGADMVEAVFSIGRDSTYYILCDRDDLPKLRVLMSADDLEKDNA